MGGSEVVRDVLIHTKLATGLAIDVPAHLIYEIADEDGALRIRRLRAVWDLRRRSMSAISSGARGMWTMWAISGRMFALQGLGGMLGYSRGLSKDATLNVYGSYTSIFDKDFTPGSGKRDNLTLGAGVTIKF